jgi:glycine cleavage system transcriptional repressor
VSVYGADHPGIVHGVTAALAERKVNVVGLSTRIAGESDGAPLYILLLELALPPGLDQQGLGELLDRVAGEQGVDVSVRAIDSDPL